MAEISSLCIRWPHPVPGAGRVAESFFRCFHCRRGMLVYSPPGGGKTTLLREFARAISCGPAARRVALIDARGELYDEDFSPACQVDVLRGYSLALGIEMATRSLSPELLVCDEISSMAEAEAVLAVQGCGVPLIASAHAGDLTELLARPPVKLLAERNVFAAYIGIQRKAGSFFYRVQGADGRLLEMEEEVQVCHA